MRGRTTVSVIVIMTAAAFVIAPRPGTAYLYRKQVKCAPHYFEDEGECLEMCPNQGSCEPVVIHGDDCFLCRRPVLNFDEEQCDGIHYTMPCRMVYGFDNVSDVKFCKNQTYKMTEYKMLIDGMDQKHWCYQCVHGLYCE